MPYVSIDWLGDHVEVPVGTTIEEVAESLVKVGIEEEQIIPASVQGPLVAGKVLSVSKEHASNGKTVNYCRVDVGQYNDPPGTGAEPSDLPSRGIICGAHNFKEGDTVAVCLPGAILPGPFPIAARKTYGHVSDGMICSLRELGLGDDHSGIIVLGDTIKVDPLPKPGTNMIPILGLGEEVLEVNVTPDRGYCFSMRGLAREYGHSTGAGFTDLGLPGALGSPFPTSTDGAFKAEVDEASVREGRAAADRFATRIVRGIDPMASSPQWMVRRLDQAGMRSISLPVDVTNYVMLDLGQPLHAYDLDFVAEPFVVRRANPGEVFTALDDSELQLDPEDILITDSPNGKRASRAVGLAGVMGGLDSEVKASTRDVVIEAAHFDPISIARTARRHKLHSESSKRFERGVDPNLALVAATRAAELIAEYGGGTIDESGWDYNNVPQATSLFLPRIEVERLTSLSLSDDQITEILVAIGCAVSKSEEGFDVTPPSWRPDLVGPAHFVEEIARLYGYDRIPARLPRAVGGTGLKDSQVMRRNVAQSLAAQGLVEVKSYPFISNSHDRQLIPESDDRRRAVRLRNPLADDAALLRTTIMDSLLDIAERNTSRGVVPLAMFEMGQVAEPIGTKPAPIVSVDSKPSDEEIAALFAGVPAQPWHVAGIMGGAFAPRSGAELDSAIPAAPGWQWSDAIEAARQVGAAGGVKIEATRTWLPGEPEVKKGPPMPKLVETPDQAAPWHPARVATLFVRAGKGFVEVGRAGELHPAVVEEYGLPARSVAFELNLDAITDLVPGTFLKVKPISAYPAAKEDFAVVVAEDVPESEIASVMRRAAGPLLESLVLFDIYRGSQLPEGHKSVAYAMTLRSESKTLDSTQVEAVRADVVQALQKRLSATLRA